MFIKRRVDPRLRSKSLGPREENDEETQTSKNAKQKSEFRPYQGILKPPPKSILKPPKAAIQMPSPPNIHATPISATPIIAAAAQQQSQFQLYSDGNRVYLGPAQPEHVVPPMITPPPISRPPPFSRPRPRPYPPRRQENSVNYRLYPTNAGKSLLKPPPITKIGFDTPPPSSRLTAASITFQGFKPPPNSEPYNPIRPPTIPFGGIHVPSTPPTTQLPSNPLILVRPPIFSTPLPSATKDDEIEAIKIVKHPIMKHHRAGGGQDIRKFREIFTHKRTPSSSSSEIFSPTHVNDQTRSVSETIMETDSAELPQNTVAENELIQSAAESIQESQKDTVVGEDSSIQIQKLPAAEAVPLEAAFNQTIQNVDQSKALNPPSKEAQSQQIIVITDERPTVTPSTSKSKPKSNKSREDGELSRSPTPEIITIDDSDDEIIEIRDPSPKSRYRGQTALGLDLYLNNLGNADATENEPLGGLFFDMKLFYQHYEEILETLIKDNKERTAYCHGIIDQLCEIGASLEVYFLMSGDVLEESRADEEFSEIQIYIASISDDKNMDVAMLMEPVYNVIKNSNIGTANFYSNTNVIVIIQEENNIAIRPLDKLNWARSSLVWACGSRVPVFKNALLLIKKAMRQFRASNELSDFVISFALIHYLQYIKIFPVFDFDLDEIDIVGAIDFTVLKPTTKQANEIFSDFLFFIKHNQNLTIECPFTKEQLDIKDTLLSSTIDLIFGIQN